MPFDLESVPDVNLASVLEKVGLTYGHRIIRSNKTMFAKAKHIRTQFRLYGDYVDIAMKEDNDGIPEDDVVIDSEFRYHFNKIHVRFRKICDAEDYSKYFSDLDNMTCKRLQIENTTFSPEALDALQELVSNKLRSKEIEFVICDMDPDATWTKPVPLIVHSDGGSYILDLLFWSMKNFSATPYMHFNILPRDGNVDASCLQQIVQIWKGSGLTSARKWFRVLLYRNDTLFGSSPLTAELIKELFADLWTTFHLQEVTEILHVETEIGSPALVKVRVDKSTDSRENIHIIFSEQPLQSPTWYAIQVDLFPNYDPQFEYSFPK